MASRTRRTRLCSRQRPGANIATKTVGCVRKLKADDFGVELASLSSFAETEHVGDHQEISAPEKLKKREAIVFVWPGSAETVEKLFGQALETWGATAAPGSAPSVADGNTRRGSRHVRKGDWVACVIHRQTFRRGDLPLPFGAGNIFRTCGVARMVAEHFSGEHSAHAQLIEEAAA